MQRESAPTTPAGLQSLADLAGRRRFVALVNVAVYGTLLVWLAAILNHGGWSAVDVAIFIAFAVAAPWSVLGVCNAALGVWLLHFHHDPLSQVAPFAPAGEASTPLRSRVAMLLTIRNEDPARAFARLHAMKDSVDATGEGARFDWFALSDTDDPRIAAKEEEEFSAWRDETGEHARLHYRRRMDNTGYKAGNIHDFCARWGADFEFMIPLDADSLMDGETILRLVRIGEAHPNIGILQSLVVGAPSRSAFARIFQFGMRAGMRTYTMGAAWWAGDCGPYWGHNALVRVAPFAEHCVLPKLGGGRRILSHDQIEAVLMRRAGFETRVLPLECGSYEENPPSLIEFARRDLRWCRGNMQYVQLFSTPGLLPMSRFQLFWAVSMFIGLPAWTAIIALAPLIPLIEDVSDYPAAQAAALYLLFLFFYLAPKLAGYLDVALTPGRLARHGGFRRFALSALVEIACSFVIGAATTFCASLFLIGLAFDRASAWDGQARDARGLTWREAARALWPPLVFGVIAIGLAAVSAPRLLWWSTPLTLGYLAAIPFTVATADPRLGAWLQRLRLCAAPEEFDGPAILRGERSRRRSAPCADAPVATDRDGVLAE